LVSRPHLPEEGPIDVVSVPAESEAPEASETQDGDEAEGSVEDSESTLSPPPVDSDDKGPRKKQKQIEDLASSDTSIPTNASEGPAAAKDSDLEMFELLDS
jgi:hypothetical protein